MRHTWRPHTVHLACLVAGLVSGAGCSLVDIVYVDETAYRPRAGGDEQVAQDLEAEAALAGWLLLRPAKDRVLATRPPGGSDEIWYDFRRRRYGDVFRLVHVALPPVDGPMAYVWRDRYGMMHVHVRDLATGADRHVFSGRSIGPPAWSAAADRLVFVGSTYAAGAVRVGLYHFDRRDGRLLVLSDRAALDAGRGPTPTAPWFSADGRHVYFQSASGPARVRLADLREESLDLDGTLVGPAGARLVRYTGDGRFRVSAADGSGERTVFPPDGHLVGPDLPVTISPDGRYLLVVLPGDEGEWLVFVDMVTGKSWTTSGGSWPRVAWGRAPVRASAPSTPAPAATQPAARRPGT